MISPVDNKLVLNSMMALVVSLFFGVAAQNLTQAIVILVLGALLLMSGRESRSLAWEAIHPNQRRQMWVLVLGIFSYVFFLSFSAWLSGRSAKVITQFVGGHLGWFLLPVLILWAGNLSRFRLSHKQEIAKKFKFFSRIVLALMGFLSLIAVSQVVFGWKLEDLIPLPWEHRATGFYSHPLTLAYVLCVFWPVLLYQFLIIQKPYPKSFFCFSTAVLLASISKAIILLMLVMSVLQMFWTRSYKSLLALLMGGSLFVGIVFSFSNPIRDRFTGFFYSTSQQHGEEYIDDRLIFWDVHWRLFKERPLFGHGYKMKTEEREAAYDRFGFSDIQQKYNAHNQWLQYLVDGGLLGFMGVIFWLMSLFYLIGGSGKLFSKQFQVILVVSLFVFLMANFVQNGIYDAEVRYSLLLWLLTFCVVPISAEKLS